MGFTLAFISVFTLAGYAADDGRFNIPEWTQNPPDNPNDLVAKLKEEGYENVTGMPVSVVNSISAEEMPGLRGIVSATRTEGGKLHVISVNYFNTKEQAKEQFDTSRVFLTLMAQGTGAGKSGIVSSSDTVSFTAPDGQYNYYRLSGRVMTSGNIENAPAADPTAEKKSAKPKTGNEQATREWMATKVQSPPKAVLSKSDIDIFVKNHSKIEKILNKYGDELEPVDDMFEKAFGMMILNGVSKGRSAELAESLLKSRNFPVSAGLRSELSKLGLGDNAFEKIQVIVYGGMFARISTMKLTIPEYGSDEMEIALEENPMLGGQMALFGSFESAIHENDMQLISSRMKDLLPLLD